MAVKLRGDGGEETDILATTTPAFVTRTAEDFLELIRLRRPDPETGQPDFERLGAWLGEHPEAQTAIQATLGAEPLASFATATYFSPHTFWLVDAAGERTAVRYRWLPEAGEQHISDDEARERGRDYLHAELAERLASGPFEFELRLQLPAEGDPLDDATALLAGRPRAGRRRHARGRARGRRPRARRPHRRLRPDHGSSTGSSPPTTRSCDARRKAYSVSAYRRWDGNPEA